MTTTVDLRCECGNVKGILNVTPRCFFHVHCYCCDCQQFVKNLNQQEKVLDNFGGTELFQTYPSHVQITEGADNIRCMQLKPKGLHRWHTACCNSPIANTMGKSKMPFIGVFVNFMRFTSEEDKYSKIGESKMKAFGKYALSTPPKDVHPTFPFIYIPKILAFLLKGKILKKHSPHPFYAGNKPISKKVVVES